MSPTVTFALLQGPTLGQLQKGTGNTIVCALEDCYINCHPYRKRSNVFLMFTNGKYEILFYASRQSHLLAGCTADVHSYQ